MELEIFTLADYAVDNGGKLTIVGTFDTIFTQTTPAIHPSCVVATKFRVANSEAGQHEFEIRVQTPDKKELAKIKGVGDVKPNPNADYSSSNFVIPIHNLKLEKLGKYTFEFYFDGEFRSGLTLHLVQIPIQLGKAA